MNIKDDIKKKVKMTKKKGLKMEARILLEVVNMQGRVRFVVSKFLEEVNNRI